MIVFYTVGSFDFWCLLQVEGLVINGRIHCRGGWAISRWPAVYWAYWDRLIFFGVLIFVMEIWEIGKLHWDVLEKLYFQKE